MRNKQRLRVLLYTLVLVFSLAGCSTKDKEKQESEPSATPTAAGSEQKPDSGAEVTGSGQESGTDNDKNALESTIYPVTVTGSDGSEVTITKQPERIVSVGPNITELIYSLNAQKNLVGRTDFCDYPAEAAEIESIGSIYPLDVEKIVSLTPDLVIASTHSDETSMNKLKELGITVLYLYEEHSIEGVYTMIETLGTVLNAKETAKQVVDTMKQTILETEEALKGRSPVDVYYVVGFGEDGEFTAGGDTFVNEILTAAGGHNIAEDVTGWSYSVERLLEKDPEVILLPDYFYDSFIATEPYSNLSAVKNNRVYVIDTNLLDRQCARNADAIREIARLLYPDAF